ncbi:hypothetical protein LVD13_01925 [Flavobacteriaceae bacterium D16]|nr:hypothetical protein [Flavobacteriaceae bacterium D16]
MNRIISILILMFSLAVSHGQNLETEKKIFHCIDSILTNEGYDIRSIINNHEKLLIKEKLLKDASAKSYMFLLDSIVENKELTLKSHLLFYDSSPFPKIPRNSKEAIIECDDNIMFTSQGKASKWQYIGTRFESEEGIEDSAWFCQVLLEELSASDYKSDFYKLRIFIVMDFVNEESGPRLMLPPIPEKKDKQEDKHLPE